MTVEQVGKSGASVTHNVCFSNRSVWVKRLQTIHHSSFDVTSAAGRRPLQDANSRCRRTGDKCPLWVISGHSACPVDVRFTPKSGHVQCTKRCRLCAKSGHETLFDHFVGDGEDARRDGQAKRLGGLEVDDQLELDQLDDRQVAGLFALLPA